VAGSAIVRVFEAMNSLIVTGAGVQIG